MNKSYTTQDSLVTLGLSVNPKMFNLGIEFGSETCCGFHIVNNWLVHLTCGLISLVNDNHVDNNLKEILVYVYFGLILNDKLKNELVQILGQACKGIPVFRVNIVI